METNHNSNPNFIKGNKLFCERTEEDRNLTALFELLYDWDQKQKEKEGKNGDGNLQNK